MKAFFPRESLKVSQGFLVGCNSVAKKLQEGHTQLAEELTRRRCPAA